MHRYNLQHAQRSGWVGRDTGVTAPAPKRAKAAGDRERGTVFTHNKSGRFESRFSTVTIQPSKAVCQKLVLGCARNLGRRVLQMAAFTESFSVFGPG